MLAISWQMNGSVPSDGLVENVYMWVVAQYSRFGNIWTLRERQYVGNSLVDVFVLVFFEKY